RRQHGIRGYRGAHGFRARARRAGRTHRKAADGMAAAPGRNREDLNCGARRANQIGARVRLALPGSTRNVGAVDVLNEFSRTELTKTQSPKTAVGVKVTIM